MKTNINFEKASFKDFENIPDLNAFERAEVIQEFTDYMVDKGQMNFRFLTSIVGCGPEMWVTSPFNKQPRKCVSLVSNDYLNFTQHPAIKAAAIEGIEQYGTGAGASPLIGGHHDYHEKLQAKIPSFFGRSPESALVFTTGYTANSATLLALSTQSLIMMGPLAEWSAPCRDLIIDKSSNRTSLLFMICMVMDLNCFYYFLVG